DRPRDDRQRGGARRRPAGLRGDPGNPVRRRRRRKAVVEQPMKGEEIRRRWKTLDPPEGLRRGLGSPALVGIAQGFTAASIYFAIGLIVERAHGLSWLVMLAAAFFFLLLVLSYVEGTSLHKERGGATVLARYGFNELWSFVAGWAILLDYLI